jgi:hypothetical protein
MRWFWSVALLLTLGGCGGLIAAEGVAERNGHSLDPTDAANYDFFDVTNDSTQPLYLRPCLDQKCLRLDSHFDWEPVEPGRSVVEQVAWGDAPPQMYAVATSTRSDVARKCLPLDASRKVDKTVRVSLSTVGSCEG